jgi:glycerol-3-phosphate dehydrogenase
MYALLGGKYTTFRRMAQDLCRELVPRLGIAYNPNLTMQPLRRTSVVGTFSHRDITVEKIERIIRDERPKTFEDLVHRRLSWLTPSAELQELAGKPKDYWERRIREN